MLFGDVPGPHQHSIAVPDSRAKYALGLKHPLAMMTERAVTEITKRLLGGI
jgi:hypothetical protein